MYTQCPACNTLFRITTGQLRAAAGKVRCGECQTVFHAPSRLMPKLPASAGQAGTETHGAPPRPRGPDEKALPRHAPPPAAAGSPTATPQPEAPTEADSDAAPAEADQPVAAEPQAVPERDAAAARPVLLSPLSAILAEDEAAARQGGLLTILLGTLASLLLLAALALQYVYLQRAAMIGHAELRPVLEFMCDLTGCQLPPQRDLTAFTLLERDVRSHEEHQGALTISATLQNRAPFAQPYPVIEVMMHDLGGQVVAARRFQPGEYLADETAAGLLAPQATAQLVLDVVDPGPEAMGFEFTFH